MAELYKSVTELMKTARGNKALQGNLGNITDFQQIVDDTPTADVEEVKHGKWIVQSDITECSNCHKEYVTSRGMLQLKEFDYCPRCGAKMDLKERF